MSSAEPLRARDGWGQIAAVPKGNPMNLLKNVCVVVPAVLLTATVVVAVATVVGLSSWEVL